VPPSVHQLRTPPDRVRRRAGCKLLAFTAAKTGGIIVFTPNNDLEELLLSTYGRPGGLGVFMQRLLVSQVVVLLKQDQEQQFSPLTITGIHGALVLALFTSPERATVWAERYPEYGTALLVDARWAIGKVQVGFGMAINPGHAVGFEVSPEGLPKLLRDFGVPHDAP